MGCFSYICPLCNSNIRTGEKCLLIHKREGRELGRVVGHYNDYGGVEEDPDFRGEHGPNSHVEVCVSEFGLPSSFNFGYMRISPKGKAMNISFIRSVVTAFFDSHSFSQLAADPVFGRIVNKALKEKCNRDAEIILNANNISSACDDEGKKIRAKLSRQLMRDRARALLENDSACRKKIIAWAEKLPKWAGAKSGIIAAHLRCVKNSADKSGSSLPFSLPDPEQGGGEARDEFL